MKLIFDNGMMKNAIHSYLFLFVMIQDMEVCPFYGHYGVCKEGPACTFKHPTNLGKTVPPAGSEEAPVSADGIQEAHQVPPSGFQQAHQPQLPDLNSTQDKN